MTISEIKKKHPRVRFYELSDKPQQKGFCLKNEEDFFSFASKVGYYIKEYDADEYVTQIINAYCKDISFIYQQSFAEYAMENAFTDISKYIRKLRGRSDLSDIYLYGLDFGVSLEYSNFEAPILAPILERLNKLLESFKIEKRVRDKARDDEINRYITKYKEPYFNAPSKTQKTEIITQLQCELKEIFGLDGRADSQYSKAGLMLKLDRLCLSMGSPQDSDS